MAQVLDVANWLLCNQESLVSKPMTNLRLNKLLYFAQVFSIMEYGKAMFHDDIEAWEFGPVVPVVYHAYKENGNRTIEPNFECENESLSVDDIAILQMINIVYSKTGTSKLVDTTHLDNSPWHKAFHEGSKIIKNDDIEEFYRPYYQEHKDRWRKKLLEKMIPAKSYRNSDGKLIIQRESF
ncbi:type II toxin-antitoxin system antitoxin SocA domain-containing protein [Globicatella sulfidifaciens]|uniref:DUF4065 domain-containing protein n=1 Tax=Globicatella sulfidifaciens TaxID=136093 RepID=A0A7X8C5M7_9LACT|nr:type II toxin-antitoxin system antitoxin SocA domain-containing protein [Globicatella sulfidifaciens]NLJ19327.1 DUF4065 domain-containing protein [Globicatella sulfidifaciens]